MLTRKTSTIIAGAATLFTTALAVTGLAGKSEKPVFRSAASFGNQLVTTVRGDGLSEQKLAQIMGKELQQQREECEAQGRVVEKAFSAVGDGIASAHTHCNEK